MKHIIILTVIFYTSHLGLAASPEWGEIGADSTQLGLVVSDEVEPVVKLPCLDDQIAVLQTDGSATFVITQGIYTKEDCNEIVTLLGRFLGGSDIGEPTLQEIEALRNKWMKRFNELD